MARTKEYFGYFDSWKVISDYIEWVKAGGVDIYGCLDTAEEWKQALLEAQNDCFR